MGDTSTHNDTTPAIGISQFDGTFNENVQRTVSLDDTAKVITRSGIGRLAALYKAREKAEKAESEAEDSKAAIKAFKAALSAYKDHPSACLLYTSPSPRD